MKVAKPGDWIAFIQDQELMFSEVRYIGLKGTVVTVDGEVYSNSILEVRSKDERDPEGDHVLSGD